MERNIWAKDILAMMYVLCSGMILVGLWLACLNWHCFYLAFIKKVYSPSWIPLLAGILLFLGFYFYPENSMSSFAWGAFLVDWGSVPGICHAILYHLVRWKNKA
jgi:hypothetical protein